MKKRIVPILAMLVTAAVMHGQNTVVSELHFPYYTGYTFTLQGKTIFYDQYNFPSKTVPCRVDYAIDKHEETPKSLGMNFVVTYYDDKGEKKEPFNSWLVLDKTGMKWGLKAGSSKPEHKHPTQAIRLPLKVGGRWTTYFSDQKNTLTCITPDTILHTYKGRVHAFGVKYTQLAESTKDYDLYVTVEEYYAQYWGKIQTGQLTYAIIKSTGKVQRVVEQKDTISQCTLPAEWEKQVPFVTDGQ